MASKLRIDVLLTDRGLAPSREKARSMLMAGEVLANGVVVTKPGALVPADADVTIKSKPRFVSRGGEKLDWALKVFTIDVHGRICADVGASTGGFTDCLLQHGAARVYAIDVGYGQLAYALRQDQRTVVMERTNARYLETLDVPVNLVTIDASFISLKLLLPSIRRWLSPQADVIALIKPQFEAGRQDVGKGGVVKDRAIHARVIEEILTFAVQESFSVKGLTTSPLKGPAGNVEFLAWLAWGDGQGNSLDILSLIQTTI